MILSCRQRRIQSITIEGDNDPIMSPKKNTTNQNRGDNDPIMSPKNSAEKKEVILS